MKKKVLIYNTNDGKCPILGLDLALTFKMINSFGVLKSHSFFCLVDEMLKEFRTSNIAELVTKFY